jgi:TetR/AcrR family transcriptional regulator, regulator of autoinduction and epiphytic fitness
MPPTRPSPLKRAAILTAALDEFEARGYRETSMDRIAARAGVSKRTVYNHFLSKEQLFDAIAAQLIERVQEVSQRPYDPSQPLDTQLEVIGGQVLDMLASPSFLTLARVTLAELIRSPELARRTYGLFRARQTGLARWLADAAAHGRLSVAEPDRAADQFMGLINAFALWPQLLGGQPVPDATERARILEPAVAMLLRQYRQRD